MKEWTTPDSRNTPSTKNLEEEEIVDALGNDGNASMTEQVSRPNPWTKMMIMMIVMMMMIMMIMIMIMIAIMIMMMIMFMITIMIMMIMMMMTKQFELKRVKDGAYLSKSKKKRAFNNCKRF